MEKSTVSRREFLGVSAMGVAVAAAGQIFPILGAGEAPAGKMKIFVCSVCGHVEFGSAPEKCPVCHVLKENFKENDAVFTEAETKFKDAGPSHAPEITIKKQSDIVKEQPFRQVDVRIGKTLHPMEEAHAIRFLDCYVDDKHIARVILTLGAEPANSFVVKTAGKKVRVVALCTVHGYWQAEAVIA
jgi:desulfoferrodoxin-like iron-binding protein